MYRLQAVEVQLDNIRIVKYCSIPEMFS